MKVSIIIPCNKDRGFLREAIESALSQSIEKEIILVSDGSKELEKTAKEFKIKYIYQEHKGLSFAVNNGVRNAKGEFIKVLNEDDLLLKDGLAFLLEAIIKDKTDFIHAKAKQEWYNPRRTRKDFIIMPRIIYPTLYDLLQHNHICGVTPLYRRDLWDRFGGWDETLWTGEEFEWHLRLLANDCKIGYCPQVVAIWRRHNQNKSMQMKVWDERVKAIKKIRRKYSD